MGKIIEAGELPIKEKVYLKKDFLGWRVVEPIVDPETKKFVWKNFFNKKGFAVTIFILLLMGVSYLAFKEQVANYEMVINNPCAYCKSCQEHTREVIGNLSFNNFKDIDFGELLVNADEK